MKECARCGKLCDADDFEVINAEDEKPRQEVCWKCNMEREFIEDTPSCEACLYDKDDLCTIDECCYFEGSKLAHMRWKYKPKYKGGY